MVHGAAGELMLRIGLLVGSPQYTQHIQQLLSIKHGEYNFKI